MRIEFHFILFSSPPKIATLFRKVHLNFISDPWGKIRKYIEFIPSMYYLNVSVYMVQRIIKH